MNSARVSSSCVLGESSRRGPGMEDVSITGSFCQSVEKEKSAIDHELFVKVDRYPLFEAYDYYRMCSSDITDTKYR